MAGNQSRGLIQASKTRGWDPTVIPARDGVAADSSILPTFDRDQGNIAADIGSPGDWCVGKLPGGTPDGWPNELGVPGTSVSSPVDFQSSQNTGNEDRRTTNADPTPAMPGAD